MNKRGSKILIILLVVCSLMTICSKVYSVTEKELEYLYSDAILWEVGENRQKVRNAREKLISYGEDSVKFIVENKFSADKSLELRAIEEILTKLKEVSIPYIRMKLKAENIEERRNAIWLAGKLKDEQSLDMVTSFLEDEELRTAAINALGNIGNAASAEKLLKYLKTGKENVKISICTAIGKIGNLDLVPDLIELFKSERISVRVAAENALVKFDNDIIEIIEREIDRSSNKIKYHLLKVSGKIGTESSIQILQKYSKHDEESLRLVSKHYLKKLMVDE